MIVSNVEDWKNSKNSDFYFVKSSKNSNTRLLLKLKNWIQDRLLLTSLPYYKHQFHKFGFASALPLQIEVKRVLNLIENQATMLLQCDNVDEKSSGVL